MKKQLLVLRPPSRSCNLIHRFAFSAFVSRRNGCKTGSFYLRLALNNLTREIPEHPLRCHAPRKVVKKLDEIRPRPTVTAQLFSWHPRQPTGNTSCGCSTFGVIVRGNRKHEERGHHLISIKRFEPLRSCKFLVKRYSIDEGSEFKWLWILNLQRKALSHEGIYLRTTA